VLSSCIQGLKDSSHEFSAETLSAESSEQNSPEKPSEENPPEKLSEDNSSGKLSEDYLAAKPSEDNSPAKPSEENSQAKLSEVNPQAKPSAENSLAKPSEENSPTETWQDVIGLLNQLLGTLKKNYVPLFLAQKIFCQTFQDINVQLFNSLLQRECCTFIMGKKVNVWLNELESWCSQATEDFVGSSWDELKNTRQALVLLVTEQKSTITYDDLTTNLCPALSTQQLYRICTLCKIDDHEDQNVSPDVISNLKLLVTDEDEDSRSFLLDNNSS
jgi:myosin-5